MTLHDPDLCPAAAIEIREAEPGDAEAAGRVMYLAFAEFHHRHGFAPDFPSVEAAVGLAAALIADPSTFGVVAVRDGALIGSNFLGEGDAIRGVGPITVAPDQQGTGVGRRLMRAVIDRGAGAPGIRLCQDSFNGLSLALYASLGFDAREPLALLAGKPKNGPAPSGAARPLAPADLDAADDLARRVTGFGRRTDIAGAIARGTAVGLTRGGRLVGYMTAPDFWILNHAVAETEADLKALILGAGALTAMPLGMLVPVRRAALFRWCLGQGLRVVKPMTLMSRGAYAEPDGGYLPSVMY
jgi:predicted N-acetyltransferase YhbS